MNQSEHFPHKFSAHCETGVTSALLAEKSIQISEAMALGIGSGLFFIYLPFVKVMGNPLVSYRSVPGSIFKKTNKRLKIKYKAERFRKNRTRGESRLNELVGKNIPVGVQANIYWLKYIPKNFRFHFNAHNLIVLGENEGQYLVSDPLLKDLAECSVDILTKARFSGGPLAPKGMLYYISEAQFSREHLDQAIYQGINETVKRMLYAPVSIVGVKGISFLGNSIAKWPNKLGIEKAKLYLSSVVRMQEEIGTGGAGFRYIYSSFLEEAAQLQGKEILSQASVQMESIADHWRQFAAAAVRTLKQDQASEFVKVSKLLHEIATLEKECYLSLKKGYL